MREKRALSYRAESAKKGIDVSLTQSLSFLSSFFFETWKNTLMNFRSISQEKIYIRSNEKKLGSKWW